MTDEQTYPARTIVKAIQHLRTLNLDDMLTQELIDMDRLIEILPVQRYDVVLTHVGERVIGAIKIIRDSSRTEAFGSVMSLAEAKKLVDDVRDGKPTVVLSTPDEARARDMLDALSQNVSTAHVKETR